MDFEEIKYQWGSSFKGEELLDKEQLRTLLKIRESSNTALKKLVRNQRLGLLISTFIYLILISGIYIFIESSSSIILIGIFTLLMAVVYYFSGKSYNRIRTVNISDEQLKPALEKTIKEVERNLKFGKGNLYKYVLIPLALITGIGIGILSVSGYAEFWQTIQSLGNRSIIKIILVVVVGSAITIPYSQYMTNRMYKQHVDELKKCLKEFDEEIENQK